MRISMALSFISFHFALSTPAQLLRVKRAPQFFNGGNPFLSGLSSILGNFLPETEMSNSIGLQGSGATPGQVGSALGVAAFHAANQILNPCSRDNRFLSQQDAVSAGQGFLGGLTGASLIHSVLGSPCAG